MIAGSVKPPGPRCPPQRSPGYGGRRWTGWGRRDRSSGRRPRCRPEGRPEPTSWARPPGPRRSSRAQQRGDRVVRAVPRSARTALATVTVVMAGQQWLALAGGGPTAGPAGPAGPAGQRAAQPARRAWRPTRAGQDHGDVEAGQRQRHQLELGVRTEPAGDGDPGLVVASASPVMAIPSGPARRRRVRRVRALLQQRSGPRPGSSGPGAVERRRSGRTRSRRRAGSPLGWSGTAAASPRPVPHRRPLG